MEAQKPAALDVPVTAAELDAAKRYAEGLRRFAAGTSAILTPAEQAVAAAANEEINMRAELTVCREQIATLPVDDPRLEEWYARYMEASGRMRRALRDQGRLIEAREWCVNRKEVEALNRGAAALAKDDDDFACDAQCSDIVLVTGAGPRVASRWELAKHDIPRMRRDGTVEYVHLWRCRSCGAMNASTSEPPNSTLRFTVAASGLRDSDPRPPDMEVLPPA
jgi:hypothetical protein